MELVAGECCSYQWQRAQVDAQEELSGLYDDFELAEEARRKIGRLVRFAQGEVDGAEIRLERCVVVGVGAHAV